MTLMLTTSYLQALKKNGLHPSDPRLKDCMEKLREAVKESVGEVMMDKDLFHRWQPPGNQVKRFLKAKKIYVNSTSKAHRQFKMIGKWVS